MTVPERVEIAPGYEIPRIVLGTWQLSEGHDARGIDRGEALRALARYVERGFDVIDCADIYTGVEELIGELLRSSPAGSVRVHTKFVPDLSALPHVDRAYVRRVVHRSLKRLGVERVDLVQFHWWDPDASGFLEAAGWLAELQREGKVRLLGTTNFGVAPIRELRAAGLDLVTHQVQYSLLDRRPEHGLTDECARHGTWLLCYGTIAGGFLTDAWLGREAPRPPWPNRSQEKYRLIIDELGGWTAYQSLLRAAGRVAARHGVGIANVATRYVLDRPRVAAAIVGVRDARHVDANLATFGLDLDREDRHTIEAVLERHAGPEGEVFGLERVADGPHRRIMRTELSQG